MAIHWFAAWKRFRAFFQVQVVYIEFGSVLLIESSIPIPNVKGRNVTVLASYPQRCD
jgi:hypothetical protein